MNRKGGKNPTIRRCLKVLDFYGGMPNNTNRGFPKKTSHEIRTVYLLFTHSCSGTQDVLTVYTQRLWKRWTANNCIVNTGCWNVCGENERYYLVSGWLLHLLPLLTKSKRPLFNTDHKGLLTPNIYHLDLSKVCAIKSPTKTPFDYYDASGSVAQINCFYSLTFTGITR